MGADNLSQLCTWFDAAYGVHPDMKSNTGVFVSFSYGLVHCKSSKQKTNTKRFTESKVVGVSNYLLYNIFICIFMVAQG